MRANLRQHMNKRFLQAFDGSKIKEKLDELVKHVNAVLRAKYPEADVVVFRRYDQARRDYCIKFQSANGPRIFTAMLNEAGEDVADIPKLRGCYSGNTFQATEEIEKVSDQLDKLVEARQELLRQKDREYNGFLLACRYLEEVEAVVPLTDEFRKELGAQTKALAVINPDIISRIAADFKAAA